MRINKVLLKIERKSIQIYKFVKGKENIKRFSWEGRAKQYWDAILK